MAFSASERAVGASLASFVFGAVLFSLSLGSACPGSTTSPSPEVPTGQAELVVTVESAPTFLGALHQFEDHRERRLIG